MKLPSQLIKNPSLICFLGKDPNRFIGKYTDIEKPKNEKLLDAWRAISGNRHYTFQQKQEAMDLLERLLNNEEIEPLKPYGVMKGQGYNKWKRELKEKEMSQ